MPRPWHRVRLAALAIAGVTLQALPAATAEAHPLHTTLTEVVADAAHHTVRATIRVFADDFGTAVAHGARTAPANGSAWEAAALAYATAVFALADRSGRPIPLHSCGTRRTGDLLWICLEGPVATDLSELQLRNLMLCELFNDQVNIVRANLSGQQRSLLFTRGSAMRRLL